MASWIDRAVGTGSEGRLLVVTPFERTPRRNGEALRTQPVRGDDVCTRSQAPSQSTGTSAR
jgi:hypothetical protein